MQLFGTLCTNSLWEPEDRLGVVFGLESRKLVVQLVTVVQLMGLLRAVRGIHIVEVSTKVSVGLAVDDDIVDAVDVVESRGVGAVVLEDPEGVTVVVRGKFRILCVDGGAWATVQVDDDEVAIGRRLADVVPEVVQGGGGEALGLGDGDGLGEEGVVFVIALQRLLDVGLVGHEDEVGNPLVLLHGDLGGWCSAASEFGQDGAWRRVNKIQSLPGSRGRIFRQKYSRLWQRKDGTHC